MLPGVQDELGTAFDAHMNGTDIEFTDSLDTIAVDPALAAAAAASSNTPNPHQELPAAGAQAPQLFGFTSSPANIFDPPSTANSTNGQNTHNHVDSRRRGTI